jgi:hypothetical protein
MRPHRSTLWVTLVCAIGVIIFLLFRSLFTRIIAPPQDRLHTRRDRRRRHSLRDRLSGRSQIFAMGALSYSDIFGSKHTTKSSRRFNPRHNEWVPVGGSKELFRLAMFAIANPGLGLGLDFAAQSLKGSL